MPVLNIAMVGSDELARELAKPTDQRDVHTYVHKESVDGQARILSLIRPAKYPERLRPLLNALSAARAGLIEVTAIDATLGEALVAFSSAGIEHGVAVIAPPQGEWIDEDMVRTLFKQAGLTGWTFEQADGIELRNAFFLIMDNVAELLASIEKQPLVSVHPDIEDKKTHTFRPLALEAHIISSMTLTVSPFQKKQLEVGDVVHASIDLQFNVGRVESVQEGDFSVRWETPLLQRIDDAPPVLIAQLDSKPRIMGSALLRKIE